MGKQSTERTGWLFLIALILPVVILGKLRLHQRNLALFLLAAVAWVTVVLIAYYRYCRRMQDQAGHAQESETGNS